MLRFESIFKEFPPRTEHFLVVEVISTVGQRKKRCAIFFQTRQPFGGDARKRPVQNFLARDAGAKAADFRIGGGNEKSGNGEKGGGGFFVSKHFRFVFLESFFLVTNKIVIFLANKMFFYFFSKLFAFLYNKK